MTVVATSTTPDRRTAQAARSTTPRRSLGERLAPAATPAFVLVVVAVAVLTIRSAVGNDRIDGAAHTAMVGLAVLLVAATAFARRRPLEALVVSYAIGLASTAIDPRSVAMGGAAAAVIAYLAGRHRSGRPLQFAVGAACVLFTATRLIGDWDMAFGSFFAVIATFILGPAAIGRGVRDRAQYSGLLRDRAATEEADRAESADRALLDERARIAGELHDVVAHALSAMVVQATGARLHATRDGARAEEAFATVERTGRDALFEIRSLLGILRDETASDEILEPQPTLEHLSTLANRSERDGLATTLRTDGAPRPVSTGVSLTGYRAVQDALRAASDEGGAANAEVVLRYEPTGLRLTITDDGRGRRAPLAVRERVQLYGGDLTASATPDGRHRVDVRLRTERAA